MPAPLFELRPVDGKGSGLFATTDIARGTRIIEEEPLIVVPPAEDPVIRFAHLIEAVESATPDQHRAFFDLYHTPSAMPRPEVQAILARKSQDATNQILIASAIFNTNSFQMGESAEDGGGVFATYSRMNHSCIPNTHASYNPTLKKLTFHAICQINKDQELLTTYIDLHQSSEERNADLSNWDFRCQCRCCVGPKVAVSDSRRKRILEADEKLQACLAGQTSTDEIPVPENAEDALKIAKDLLEALKEEGMTGLRYGGA